MNNKNTKPITYQTSFYLPKKQAMDYQYGMLNNIIHVNIPIENTDLKIELNIEIDDIMKMDIKKIFITNESFNNTIKQLQGR